MSSESGVQSSDEIMVEAPTPAHPFPRRFALDDAVIAYDWTRGAWQRATVVAVEEECYDDKRAKHQPAPGETWTRQVKVHFAGQSTRTSAQPRNDGTATAHAHAGCR